METQPSTSAPPSSPREVHIPIDEPVDPVHGEIIQADPVQAENSPSPSSNVRTSMDGQVDPALGEIINAGPVERENEAVDDPVQGQIVDAHPSGGENGADDFINQRTNYRRSMELYEAAIKGNVEKAVRLIGTDDYLAVLGQSITPKGQTILHVAAGANQAVFAVKMLNKVNNDQDRNHLLELNDTNGNNALCIAAMAGANKIVEKMLEMNPNLLTRRGGAGRTPLQLAVLFGKKETAQVIYKRYGDNADLEEATPMFCESIHYNLYDLALELLTRHGELAMFYYEGHGTALHMLARNPSAFNGKGKNLINHEIGLTTGASELVNALCEKILEIRGRDIGAYMTANKQLLFDAAKLGNSRFLEILIRFYPDLVCELNEEGQTIFHIAILHRQINTFNLMHELGFNREFVAVKPDERGNTLLHLAASYPDNIPRQVSMVPGAALQMQQELKTFKGVESLVMPSFKETQNEQGLTPRELFTKDHKDLLKRGEDWMRKTAEQCMLVATLIATVVFAAAFSVPGDYDNQKGIPNHLENGVFCSFTLADAVALSSASISILFFLSILTSRYEEEDFEKSLPLKLMLGLITLFISISAMTLSFSLSFLLFYTHAKVSFIAIPIFIFAFVFIGPVILFLYLQYGLLKDIFRSSKYSLFSSKQIDY